MLGRLGLNVSNLPRTSLQVRCTSKNYARMHNTAKYFSLSAAIVFLKLVSRHLSVLKEGLEVAVETGIVAEW